MINLWKLAGDAKRAIVRITEAEQHIPAERFKVTLSLLENVKSILEGMAEEMEKEVKILEEERKEEEEPKEEEKKEEDE